MSVFGSRPLTILAALLLLAPADAAAQASLDTQSPAEQAAKVESESHRGHVELLRSVAFSPDGRLLATGDIGGSVKLWEVATGVELRTLSGRQPVRFSPDGQLLATKMSKGVGLWDVATGQPVRSFPVPDVESFVFSPDGEWIAVAVHSGKAGLFEVKTGKEVRAFAASSVGGQGVAFSPDGRWLATAGAARRTAGEAGSSAKLWDVSTGNEVRTFQGEEGRVSGTEYVHLVTFSPDGQWLATDGGDFYDHTIKLWELETGRQVRTFAGHPSSVTSVVFSPDGRWLASQGGRGHLVVWEVGSGRMAPPIAALEVPDGWEDGPWQDEGLDFSPDGRWLAVAHKRGVKLFDVTTGNLVRTFHGSPDLGRWHLLWRLLRIISVERSAKPPAGLPKVEGADKGFEYWRVGVELENHRDWADEFSSPNDRIRLCNKKQSCDRLALYDRQVGYPLIYVMPSFGMQDLMQDLARALEKEPGKKVLEKLSVGARPHGKIDISLVFVAPKKWALEDTLLYFSSLVDSLILPLRPTNPE